jgi:hypothetical protein
LLLSRQLNGTRSIALRALVAASIVGCSGLQGPEPRLFRTALPLGNQPLPLVLSDQTGLVTGIGPAADPQGLDNQPVILADPSDPMAFVIAWVGSPCDEDAALSFMSKEGGYRLQLSASPGALGCQLLATVPRGVRIVTSTAIPLSSIEPTGSG